MNKYQVTLTFIRVVQASDEEDAFEIASQQFQDYDDINASNADDILIKEI